jgi:hypothetical protein
VAQSKTRVRPGADRINPRAGAAPAPLSKVPSRRRPLTSKVVVCNIIGDSRQAQRHLDGDGISEPSLSAGATGQTPGAVAPPLPSDRCTMTISVHWPNL